MGEARKISFEKDIVDDVLREYGDRWTRQQVTHCLRASVAYLNHLVRFTDYPVIRIPYIGYALCNVKKMRARLSLLEWRERRFGLSSMDKVERSCLERKIAEIEDMDLPRTSSMRVNLSHRVSAMRFVEMDGKRKVVPFEAMEDFQAKKFSPYHEEGIEFLAKRRPNKVREK